MKKLFLCVSMIVGAIFLAGCTQSVNPNPTTVTPNQLEDTGDTNQEELTEKTRDDFSAEEKMNVHMCLMGGGEDCETIFDEESRATYEDAIEEQCDIMAGMEKCNEYLDTDTKIVSNAYDLSVAPGAPEVGTAQIIELEDGDSYTITIQEVKKTINGKSIRMLAYNGTIPGPILKAPTGSKINLTVTNEVDDIVTTVHHHGLRHDDRYDGVPKDMGGYDEPISKGESLEYVLEFPDSGLFWYHPHVREDFQQEMGLYGNYLIETAEERTEIDQQVNSEQVLMLDDLFLDEDGEMVPFDNQKGTRVVMGRFGNAPIINGDTQHTINLKQGEVTRLYLTNVANVTPFNITIPGLEMKLVGGDIGKYEREEAIENLVIAPAERYIIDVYASTVGERSMMNQMNEGNYVLGTIVVSDEEVDVSYLDQFNELRSNEGVIADIDQYREYFDKPLDKIMNLDVEMDGMMGEMPSMDHGHAGGGHGDDGHDDSIALPGGLTLDPGTIERKDEMAMMNEASTTDNTRWYLVDDTTGERNMDIKRTFDQGDKVKIRIYNDPESVHPMQHPIHFHGQRFLVLNKNGEENTNLVWKDTTLVPTGEYVDILVDMSNPGKRMVHCHIAEHLTAGMMMHFEVLPKE